MIDKKIKARVCKGFITRFNKEEEWDEWLIPFKEKELVDADAIPYYLQGEDGKYHEYYGHFAPEEKQVYVVAEAETIKVFARIEMTCVFPSELIDGEKIYYIIKKNWADKNFSHGPFTIRILQGIIHLENDNGVIIPLSKFGEIIQLLRPTL